MDKDVIVSIKSRQIINGEDESIELITAGKLYKENDEYSLVYEETEISGMKGTITTVNIKQDEVNLIRSGTTSARMSFKKGVRNVSFYSTPYGVLEIVIEPFLVDIDINENGGDIKMSYSLDSGIQKISINELYIKIREKSSKQQQ